jgi:hypothetical protein
VNKTDSVVELKRGRLRAFPIDLSMPALTQTRVTDNDVLHSQTTLVSSVAEMLPPD